MLYPNYLFCLFCFMKCINSYRERILAFFILICILSFTHTGFAQLKKVYVDNTDPDNGICKMSFYAPSEGYVAFRKWIGYTTDSGRTFTKKYITLSNVNFNGFPANLLFGFGINGMKAFDKNKIIVYGEYGLVPSILYSTDGGNSFKLIFNSLYDSYAFNGGITDMVFPQNNNIGYAIDADRILKTTDGGLTWTTVRTDPGSLFDYLEAVDNNTIFALSTDRIANKLLKTTNGGSSWQRVALPVKPAGIMRYAHFLTAGKGWLSMSDNGRNECFYQTTDGGSSWTMLNNAEATPLACGKIKFLNDSIGYAITDISDKEVLSKTMNGGVTWEPVAGDDDSQYFLTTYRDLQALSVNHLWLSGGHGFIELTTNGGGTTLPKAYFRADTAGANITNNVTLINYSKPGYQFKWYVNGVLVSTNYNTSYTHNISRQIDSIQLIATNGLLSDTSKKYQYFVVPDLPVISTFLPATGSNGTLITINGSGFTNVSSVKFGGTAASAFTIVSDKIIKATVANGASGPVSVTDIHGTSSASGFVYYAPPVVPPPAVSAVTPGSGPVGTAVTITGNNFNTSPLDNLVYFGAVRAIVSSSTPNQIVCTVPVGASYEPISVLNKATGLSGSFIKPFNVTFADSSNFTPNSFTDAYTIQYMLSVSPKDVIGKDIDGDGKPDLISTFAYGGSDSITVNRNSSTNNSFSFEPRINLSALPGYGSGKFAVNDLDGDGKPDIAGVSNNAYVIILNNLSSPGNIAFSNQVVLPTLNGTQEVALDDIDGDGRNDIAVASYDNSGISVIRNTSFPGFLSFAETKNFTAGRPVISLAVGDLDGDGKKDIVTCSYTYPSPQTVFSCFRNTGSVGIIDFAAKADFTVSGEVGQGGDILLADYDNDNKLDVIIVNNSNYSIYRNISSAGSIAFAPVITVSLKGRGQGGAVSNLSGDNRPDLVIGNWSFSTLSLIRNLSAPATVKSDPVIDLDSRYPYYTNTADFNLDGKMDIISSASNDGKISILKNNIGVPIDFSTCTAGNVSLTSDIGGASYQWQVDTSGGFFNLSDNANLSGSHTKNLSFTGVPQSWNNYKYRCEVDGYFSSIYKLKVAGPVLPTVTISASDTAVCYGTPVTFTAKGTNAGTNPSYSWLVNGVINKTTSTSSFTSASLKNNDQVKAVIFSSDYCSNYPTALSNTIIIGVTGSASSVSISTSDSISCQGSTATFTATVVNIAGTPSYQWTVNGVNAGTDSPVFNTSSLSIGSSDVKVTVTGKNSCAAPVIITSNAVTARVNPSVSPTVSIFTSDINVCAGTSVKFTASAGNLGGSASYQWQVDSINVGTNSPFFTTAGLVNGSRVRLIMMTTSFCGRPVTVTSNVIVMNVTSTIPGVTIIASSAVVCPGSSVTFTATPVSGGSPVYQWFRNRTKVGTNSPTYISNTLTDGDSISVAMTSNAVCAIGTPVNSNIIVVKLSSVTPGITIAGSTTVTQGSSVMVSASVVDGGSQPAYQWQDSTHTHNWQDIAGAAAATIMYSPAMTGNKIRCLFISNASCALPDRVTSNILMFTVSTGPVTTTPSPVRYYPNPVQNILTVDSLSIADKWQHLIITRLGSGQVLINQNITGKTKVQIPVEMLPAGMYLGTLTRQEGGLFYFKFMKL